MKKGTTTTLLGRIVDLVMGQAPSSKDTNFDGRGTPFVKVGEFGPLRPVIHEWTTNPLRMARRTDVLLCVVGATCGKINLGEECAIGRSVAAIRPHPGKLDQIYLYYFMMTLVERLRSGSVGAAQTVISKEMVETVQIPFPSLIEQQRIVGILDEAFAAIATAKANAEKNLQNARALFESRLQSIFIQRGKGWVEKPLGECFKLKSGDSLTSKAMIAGPFPVYGGNGIAGRHKEFNLSGDNVIIGRVGALCGNARHITEKIWLTDNAFSLVEFSCEFDNAFLTYLLNYKNLRSLARQTAQPVISNSSLKDLVLNFPEAPQQKRIADQLDVLREETERLARLYERKLAALAALKRSLLHQAFTGNL